MNICNIEYDDELNKRIHSRIYPTHTLKPLFETRPVSTKYTFFQTVNEQPINKTKELMYNNYTPQNTFNPGNKAPIDYFINNIDTESVLRNQFMALQKSSQSVYVPELNSSLYENHQMYYKPDTITDCKTSMPEKNYAPAFFNNFTRNNLRND
jgi:hypothetical protein